jgi:hypothetical protein
MAGIFTPFVALGILLRIALRVAPILQELDEQILK